MIAIVLAAALASVLIVLLFRRLRRLSRQLTELRVARDSEEILQQIGVGGGSRPIAVEQSQDPVRRKRHLSLYIGGLSGTIGRLRWRRPRYRTALLAGGATAGIALGAAVTLLVAGSHGLLPSGPRAAPPQASGRSSEAPHRPAIHGGGTIKPPAASSATPLFDGSDGAISSGRTLMRDASADDGDRPALVGSHPPTPSASSTSAPPSVSSAPEPTASLVATPSSTRLCAAIHDVLHLGTCVHR